MADPVEQGLIVSVAEQLIGDELAVDAPAGAMTVQLVDAVDFDEGGGQLRLGDEVVPYTSADLDTDILQLATPLLLTYVMGEPVFVHPEARERLAMVQLDVDGEAVQARVPHALYDRLPEGIRDAPERVTLSYDGKEWVIADVLGAEPVVDGSFIDPNTVPPPATDGLPPASSPTPAVRSGIGTLFITWEPVENADPVTYDVHLSNAPIPTPNQLTLVGSLAGIGPLVVRALKDGTLLTPGTLYYIRLVARDDDGPAAPSLEVSGTPIQATSADIAVGAITADLLAANAVIAGKIAANAVTSSTIAADAVTATKIATGAITADKVAAGAITASKLDADAINGKTITGATIQTAASGVRVLINGSSQNRIAFQAAPGDGVASHGAVWIEGDNTRQTMHIEPPTFGGHVGPNIDIISEPTGAGTASAIQLEADGSLATNIFKVSSGIASGTPVQSASGVELVADPDNRGHIFVRQAGSADNEPLQLNKGAKVYAWLASDTYDELGDLITLDSQGTGRVGPLRWVREEPSGNPGQIAFLSPQFVLNADGSGRAGSMTWDTSGQVPTNQRWLTAAQTLTTGTWTALALGSGTTLLGGITWGSNVWTIPKSGKYLVTANVTFNANATGRRIIRLQHAGTTVCQTESTPGSQLETLAFSRIISVTAGQTVGVEAHQTSGAGLGLAVGQAQTNACVHYVGA